MSCTGEYRPCLRASFCSLAASSALGFADGYCVHGSLLRPSLRATRQRFVLPDALKTMTFGHQLMRPSYCRYRVSPEGRETALCEADRVRRRGNRCIPTGCGHFIIFRVELALLGSTFSGGGSPGDRSFLTLSMMSPGVLTSQAQTRHYVLGALLVNVVATLATTPMAIYHFDRAPACSLIANFFRCTVWGTPGLSTKSLQAAVTAAGRN